MRFDAAFEQLPLIAILRGLPPEQAKAVGRTLHESGFGILEVPLNDEDQALTAIEVLRQSLGETAVVGAGTVTSVEQVARVKAAGGTLIVSPDTNPEVIAATREAGMVSCPGFATPTEAFIALRAGADLLKFFPASVYGTEALAAIKTVLPAGTRLVAVGGISADTAAEWKKSGAAGLGLNSALYQPSRPIDQLGRRANEIVAAWSEADAISSRSKSLGSNDGTTAEGR